MQTRRRFLKSSAATIALAALARDLKAAAPQLKIGATDWNLEHTAKPTSIEFAKSIGFDGVEVSLGRTPRGESAPEHLPLTDRIDQFIAESKTHGLPIASTCLDILHQNYLKVKGDPLGPKWVAESVPLTKKLGARVILLPFFGKGALETKEEMDYVADVVKEIAPQAERAGVIFGLENTISAENNARILDRIKSDAVKVYYDVGNSHPRGFDIYKEIRWLGRDRICQFHLKDNPHYLGQGKIDFKKVIEAIAAIEFKGWAQLETVAPSKDVRKDMTTNLTFVRDLLGKG